MADAPAPQTPQAQALFALLVSRFGLSAALQLLPLLSGDSSTASKAFAGAGLAGQGANVAGKLSGTPALSSLGSAAGLGLGLAGLGYGAYNTATNPNLSPSQKGANIGGGVGGLVGSYFTPWGAIPGLAAAIGDILQKSGSPQLRGAGRGLTSAGRPVPDITKSPTDKGWLKGFNETMIEGGPGIKAILNAIGFDPFSSKPTTGTMFRREVSSIFDRIPQLKGTPTSAYNIDPAKYSALPQAVRDAALKIGTQLSGLAPDAKSNPNAYAIQISNMLLNRFGSAGLPQGVLGT